MGLEGKGKMNTLSPHNSSEMSTVMVAPPLTPRRVIKIKIKTPGKSIEIVNFDKNRSSSMDSHNKRKDGDQKDLKLGDNYGTTYHPCTLCHNKVFTTKKKLYGHMRVHSDRPYRGMVPPKEHTTHPSPAKEESAIKEPASRRKNASSRGQKRSHAHHSWADRMKDYESQINSGLNSVEFHPFCELDMMSAEDQAAVVLQMLSEGVSDNSISWTKARALVTGVNDYYVESSKRRKIEKDDEEDADDNEEEEAHEKTRAYLCYTCNKSFPTPQALGGHRTSHTKVKNNFEDGDQALEKDKVISEKHPCKQCDAVFPCGQALGGHMRKHFMEAHSQDIALLLTAPTTTIEEPSAVNRQIRHVSDFDLNNEPMQD